MRRVSGWIGSALVLILSLRAVTTSATLAPAGPERPSDNTSVYFPLITKNSLPEVTVTAPLGQIITATLEISVATQLYEAWDVDPPAPLAPLALRALLPAAPDGPLTPALREQLQATGRADILIYLTEQADLSAVSRITDWDARGLAVLQALQATATRTQQPLMDELRARGYAPQSFWIVNGLLVRDGTTALAEWLAGRAEVALLTPNALHAVEVSPAAPAAIADVAWGVDKIGAPRVWSDWGVTGAGIVVANIDTGAMYTHTALFNNYRGNLGADLINDYNWYDPAITPTVAPDDHNGHGTHTMGTIAGAEGLGVAPGAQWIAARGCASNFCSDEDLLKSAQWILAPTDATGENPRPDLRPHIVNNSWGALGDDPWYLASVQAWNAAGIFSAFANGNSGTLFGCGSTIAPGNYAESFAVGATDALDFIADFSSRGPTADGRIKPELSAPGVGIPSAWPDGGVTLLSGTSMATPHVAGAAALLWSANPALIGNIPATQYLLTSTVLSLYSAECGNAPNAVPNNVFGWGRLDAWRAVQAARVEVPWLALPAQATAPSATLTVDARQVAGPGQYTARVWLKAGNQLRAVRVIFNVTPASDVAQWTGELTDRWGAPAWLFGRVQLADGPAAFTDANGSFTLTLPLGAYTATASAYGFVPESAPVSITAPIHQPITLTLNAPHLFTKAMPLSATLPFGAQQSGSIAIANHGPQTLTLTVSVPPLEWSVAEIISPTLYDLSAFTPLSLTDDSIYASPLNLGFTIPIFGVLTDHVYLSSNGWVSAYKTNSPAPLANCLPSASLPPATLAAFWADLDPSQGGAVRVGAVTSDTYVISFEDVPHWQEKPNGSAPRFTFQMALHGDGRVDYLYGAMNALPGRWGVGTGWNGARGQSLACYRAPQTLTGRGWSLLNQPLPNVWLSASPLTVTVPPGGNTTLTATLSGLGYVPWRTAPFEGVVRLTTNDPRQPMLDIAAQLSTSAAPFVAWLPLLTH